MCTSAILLKCTVGADIAEALINRQLLLLADAQEPIEIAAAIAPSMPVLLSDQAGALLRASLRISAARRGVSPYVKNLRTVFYSNRRLAIMPILLFA
jgi:hypothetical protein